MADRSGSIRAALDANNRACDGIVNLVASTESQLEELRDIVRPINARTLDLDRALRNLSVVTLETEGWLARIDAANRAERAGASGQGGAQAARRCDARARGGLAF